MQDALFHQHLKTLHADKHSGQSISLIVDNAIIWTGEDKVIHADKMMHAMLDWCTGSHLHVNK